MIEWMTILEVQEILAGDISRQLSIAMSKIWFSSETADHVAKTITGHRDIALNIRDNASATGYPAAAMAAEAVLQQWDKLLAMFADTAVFGTSESMRKN